MELDTLSASASDAALVSGLARHPDPVANFCPPRLYQQDLATQGRFLLSTALTVRGRVEAGSKAGWDKNTGQKRLEEAVGRLAGSEADLAPLLRAGS